MTQSKNTDCYIFPKVKFALRDFYYCYPRFFLNLNHGNGSESGSVSEERFFWGGALGGQRWRGGAGGGRGDLKGRRERKRSRWRGGRESFSKARGHVNLGKM